MAEVTKNVLKGYFTKGSVPTQSNYEDFIDTMVTGKAFGDAMSSISSSLGNGISGVGNNLDKAFKILGQKSTESVDSLVARFASLGGDYTNVFDCMAKVKAFLEDADASDETINRWQEIESFLSGITDSDSLTAMLADLKSEIEGNLAVDSALSATSEHALQNKVLYDELRISGTKSITIPTSIQFEGDGSVTPVTVLDADDTAAFPSIEVGGIKVHIFPLLDTLQENAAYYVINAKDKVFVLSNTPSDPYDTYCLGFDSHEATYLTSLNSTRKITLNKDFITVSGNATERIDINERKYYGLKSSASIYDASVWDKQIASRQVQDVVSIKTKIAELEARLAAVPTNYLEIATDMSAYASAATGKVLLYLGATTQDFTHGYVYEKTASGWNNISVSPVIN